MNPKPIPLVDARTFLNRFLLVMNWQAIGLTHTSSENQFNHTYRGHITGQVYSESFFLCGVNVEDLCPCLQN